MSVDEEMNLLGDPEAERAVLGSILLDNACIEYTHELSPLDFYEVAHSAVFTAMRQLRERSEAIDMYSLPAELRRMNRYQAVGGLGTIMGLTETVPTTAHVQTYVRIVADLAAKRGTLWALEKAGQRIAGGEAQELVLGDLGRETQKGSTRNLENLRIRNDMEAFYETVTARANGTEKALITPWEEFNVKVGGRGLWPGMYVLVGNTGSGKTQWAVQLMTHAAEAGELCLYIALELGRVELNARIMGTLAHVPWSKLWKGEMNAFEIEGVFASHGQRMADLPIYLECSSPFGYGADTMMARAAALKPRVVVLDYLQVCSGRANEETRTVVGRVSYIARSIAKDLGAVVIVLSSTARQNYAKLVNDPKMDPADFVGLGKESGEIEFAADSVLVMAKNPDSLNKNERTMVVAKQRAGEPCRVKFEWSGTLFTALPYEPELTVP